MTKYSTSLIQRESEFAQLRLEWNALACRAVDANTFLTHDWLYAWWCAYQPDASLAIVTVKEGQRIVGIAPMMLMRQGVLGRIFRRLRFIGDGTSETDHMNFIVCPEHRAEVLRVLLAVLDSLPWDIAHFNQVPESSANAADLLRVAEGQGWLVSAAKIPCPIRILPGTYDELLKSLPSRLRTSVRSARRDLASRYAVEFGQITRKEQLAEALDMLYRNHAGRWQARGQQGVFIDPRKRRFYSDLSERLLESGDLRFFFLRLNGRTVAQQFCFDHGGTVMLLQEGFDFNYAKQNVGNVLRAMVFEWLIANGAKAYDFLAGTSRHKQSWAGATRNDLNLRMCRPTLIGKAAFNLPRLLRQARGQGGETQSQEGELVA